MCIGHALLLDLEQVISYFGKVDIWPPHSYWAQAAIDANKDDRLSAKFWAGHCVQQASRKTILM